MWRSLELQCHVYSRFVIAKIRIGIHVCGVLYSVAVNERGIESVSRPCVRITGLITAILSNNRSHTSRLCVVPTCVVRYLYSIGTVRIHCVCHR